MTDEDMAEARATKFADINFNEPDNYGNEKEVGHFSYYTGFLAGLEAGRPKWHKVADGDLPKEEGSYLLYLYDEDTKSTFYEIFGVARRCVDRDDMYLESMIWTMNDIIAWCEIPRYTEE